ncbi:MAG: SDR family oxidoreductase [Alkalinema sp. RU_4_3]|nr:SDR family oxidoreductase [Alkalinema sp. RU_4_3]
MATLTCKSALITGASRGVGASVAEMLAAQGADVVINYRSKAPRAEAVAAKVTALGRRAVLAQADMTNLADLDAMVLATKAAFGKLDLLILNASGGLEKDKPLDYAMQLNMTAQMALVDRALPLMPPGSRIVFVTSHLAHFHGQKPVYDIYEPVAVSKHAGEKALRDRIPALTEQGISIIVVSGDLIEGTITPKLMERAGGRLIEERREQAGSLPSVEDFAAAIVAAAGNEALTSGETIYVGSTEW